mmetsp:Transcript_49096/g.158562  ORF Transcript_49096/g.158562 Transcript_49096/m.158562 type:complete len:404 (+) Transcript_49096:681-1892(+)
MHDEDLVVQNVTEGRGTEDLGEEFAHPLLILGLQLTEETIEVVGHLTLVVATVHEDVTRVSQLESNEREDDLDTPGATIHEVAVEHESVVRRGVAGQAQHVGEVPQLPVEVAHDGDFLALADVDPAKGLFLHEDVEDVKAHHVRILLRQELAFLVICDRGLKPGLIDGPATLVPRAGVAGGLREGFRVRSDLLDGLASVGQGRGRDLVLDERGVGRQVRIPLVCAVDVGATTVEVGGGGGGGATLPLELGILDGEGQLRSCVAHAALIVDLELARGVVLDLILDDVHDVQEVPIADVLAGHSLDGIASASSGHPGLPLRISGVAALLIHLQNVSALAAGARSVGEDTEGPLLENGCMRGDDLRTVREVELLLVLDLVALAVPQGGRQADSRRSSQRRRRGRLA